MTKDCASCAMRELRRFAITRCRTSGRASAGGVSVGALRRLRHAPATTVCFRSSSYYIPPALDPTRLSCLYTRARRNRRKPGKPGVYFKEPLK